MASFLGGSPAILSPTLKRLHLSSSSSQPPRTTPPSPPPQEPFPPAPPSSQQTTPLAAQFSLPLEPKQKPRTPAASPDSTDWIASSLTRRFGLGAGLAWVAFLAFGVVSEQIKTRLEASQQEAGTRDVEEEREVALPGGVRYYEQRVGGGATPLPGDLVVIDLKGTVEGSGEVFVDTFGEGGKPLALVLGSRPYTRGMCEGVESALRLMKAGGKARVVVPPGLGFGDKGADLGSGVQIPPSSTLEFVVQVDKAAIVEKRYQEAKCRDAALLSWSMREQDNLMAAGVGKLATFTIGSFADDNVALDAAYEGVVVADMTHFGRIRVSGEDRVNFLHNQSTANFNSLSEGEGCDTVFVTPTARTIDLAHAWVMKNATMLLVSPLTCKTITDMLSRYIFFADKVEVNDITKRTCFFVLLGPKSNQVMEALKVDDLIGQPYGTHRHYKVNGMPVTVGVGSILSKDGFSFLMAPESAESIWKTILHLGAVPMGTGGWERLRILKGRPAPGNELTDEYNVLEAGLWMTISLDKGCYKGQETISRLITYNGVKQRLWGIRLSGPADSGSPIIVDNKKVGALTSYAVGRQDGEHFGLGYIKRQAGSAGAEVTIGTVSGTLVEVPFLCHSLQT